MYKAVFRIESDDPYSSSTANNETSIELWCNDHCDLLHVTGDQQADVEARWPRRSAFNSGSKTAVTGR